jgi:ABC-2 type transport system ATP-binding protein
MSQPSAAADAAAPIIQARGLSHRYPATGRDALQNVDFEVAPASVAGLLGPNGAGKSTLLAILNGITPPQRGSVRVAGRDPRERGWLRGATSLVPQEYAFYEALTGRENLAFLAGVHRLPRAQWQRQLEYCTGVCRLDEVLDRRAGTYSGGLKRRLNLALGLINAPQVLFLDEPTVGVDAESRQYITEAITTLQSHATTIVYTSHYMEEVERLCERVTVIDRGRTVAAGSLPELLARPGDHPLEVQLDRAASSEIAACLTPWAPHWVDALTVRLAAADAAAVAAVAQALADQGVGLARLRHGERRLEDVYLELVGERGVAS